MTSELPSARLATMRSTTPSCQSVPMTKNISAAATAPSQAKPASIRVGRGLRSAMPPTTISTSADTMVDTVVVYAYREPGETARPSTGRVSVQLAPSGRSGQAAAVATDVRYGPMSTVAVVVT